MTTLFRIWYNVIYHNEVMFIKY